jgi:hypothetical protein
VNASKKVKNYASQGGGITHNENPAKPLTKNTKWIRVVKPDHFSSRYFVVVKEFFPQQCE